MKTILDISDLPSPNFDERTLPISLLVLHYTGMETGEAAITRLCDPAAKVSAHYVVEEDGQIFRLVDEDYRAWHAGVSEWRGETNINSNSIGVEIVNGGHDFPDEDGNLPKFPDVQVNAVIALCKDIMGRHNLTTKDAVAHSDISPDRKVDPGEHFPWASLAATGIGIWPDTQIKDRRVLFGHGARDRGVSIAQSGLAHFGYGARVTGVMDDKTVSIIKALQRRFRPGQIDGVIDMQTMAIIRILAEA